MVTPFLCHHLNTSISRKYQYVSTHSIHLKGYGGRRNGIDRKKTKFDMRLGSFKLGRTFPPGCIYLREKQVSNRYSAKKLKYYMNST